MGRLNERVCDLVSILENFKDDHEPEEIADFEKELEWLRHIQSLWDSLEDHPYDPETECITAPFIVFPAGTHREEIWHWFEKSFDLSVVEDLMYPPHE